MARPTSTWRTRTSRARARGGCGPRRTALPPSTTSATGACESGVRQVEDAHGLCEERVVAARLLARALEHGFEALRLRCRGAADVEEMDRRRDGGERGVVVQTERLGQDFERHAVLDVSEFRAIEVVADRLLRAFARP